MTLPRNRRKVLGTGCLMALLTGCGGPTVIEDCAASADIDVICNLAKPEDLAALADSGWLLISELGSRSEPGHVAAWHTAERRLLRPAVSVSPMVDDPFPVCGPPPEGLKPRGFHLRVTEDQATLLVVNAGSAVRVERYNVRNGVEPELHWQGCVRVPDHITPNDVAALPDGGFVVSHMYTPPRSRWLDIKFLFGWDTGYAARWHPDQGWQQVPGSEASFPNGIETDLTGRIFLAATYGQDLTAIDLDGGNRRRVPLPVQPDNLTWGSDGRLLAAGHTGVPILGTRGCRNAGDAPCAFPFAIAAIDPTSLEVETIYAHSEGRIPGPSVALTYADKLYLGTFFGDRISVIKLAEND